MIFLLILLYYVLLGNRMFYSIIIVNPIRSFNVRSLNNLTPNQQDVIFNEANFNKCNT